VADHFQRQVNNALGDASGIHQFTGQHKERNGQQRETVGAGHQVLRHDLEIDHVQLHHQRQTTQQQRERNRNAQKDAAEQRAQKYQDGHWDAPLPD